MAVIGPRQALAMDEIVTQHMQANAARDYNPTLNAIAATQTEMKDVLAANDAKHEPKTTRKRAAGASRKSRGMSASSKVALHNAYLERLQALKYQFDNSYEPLLQLLMQNAPPVVANAAAQVAAVAAPAALPGVIPAALPAANPAPGANVALPAPAGVATPAPPPAATTSQLTPSTSTIKKAPRSAAHALLLNSVSGAVPRRFQKKWATLREIIQSQPSSVSSDSSGGLVIRGNTIPNSSFHDVFRALYETKTTTGVPPVGLNDLLQTLQEMGVPNSLFGSQAARAAYSGLPVQSVVVDSSNVNPGRPRKTAYRSLTPSGRLQSGKGFERQPCFPGQPIKFLRLY